MTNRSGPEEWRDPAGGETDVDEPTLPGGEAVPFWTMISICLGLVALTGSFMAICLVGTAIVIRWLVRTAGPDDGVNRDWPPGPYGSF